MLDFIFGHILLVLLDGVHGSATSLPRRDASGLCGFLGNLFSRRAEHSVEEIERCGCEVRLRDEIETVALSGRRLGTGINGVHGFLLFAIDLESPSSPWEWAQLYALPHQIQQQG